MRVVWLVVGVAVVLGSLVSRTGAWRHVYSAEFQTHLQGTLEAPWVGDRAALSKFHIEAFERASKVSAADFEATSSVYVTARQHMRICTEESQSMLRTRVYVAGTREGEATIDLKVGVDGLTRQQAESFALGVAPEYADKAEWQIERDYHPCYHDYSADQRVTLPSDDMPPLRTCADAARIFPHDFACSEVELIDLVVDEAVITEKYRGTLLDMPVTLTIEYVYETLEDALHFPEDYVSGEFSFTVTSTNGGPISLENYEELERVYGALVEDLEQDCFDDSMMLALGLAAALVLAVGAVLVSYGLRRMFH